MALSPAGAYIRFSRSAWLAASRSWSAPMACTVAATAGAGGVAGDAWVGWLAAAGVGAAGAASSCLEQAPSAAARSRHAHSRDFGEIVMDNIGTPPWKTCGTANGGP